MANKNFIVHNGLTVGNVTIDAATGNITGVGNLAFASGSNGTLAAGNSNVLVVANGNVAVSSAGNANIVVVTSTGANVAGYANIALGTITAAQPILSKSVTWNNASVTFTALSTSITDTASAAGSNIADWKVGGVSQFSVNKAGNTSIAGTLNVTGNANTGNLGTGTVIATTANLTTINSGLLQNGTSNVTVTSSGNIALNVTAANNYVFATGSFAPNGNGAQQLGLTGARWSNIWGLASSAQYADLAEYYVSDADYEPGTVMDFGGENEVTICGNAMSQRIAGVVSTEPGYVMNDGQAGEFTLPIALQGRVPTKVVGKISKGDMMVSAGNGHAQSCSAPVIGSVIGKALADFDGVEGVIEVVIGRV